MVDDAHTSEPEAARKECNDIVRKCPVRLLVQGLCFSIVLSFFPFTNKILG